MGDAKFFRNPYQSAVTVKVGSEGAQRSFIVHTELLNYRSSFFKAATTGNWDEAKTGIINLPADDPQVFEIFLDWLYQRKLDLNPYQAQNLSLILALWIFGDKRQAPAFQNAVAELLRTFANNHPTVSPEVIDFAFENTVEGSPLRTFLTDIFVWQYSIAILVRRTLDEACYPKAFVLGVVERFFNLFPRPNPNAIMKSRPYVANARVYYVPEQEVLGSETK